MNSEIQSAVQAVSEAQGGNAMEKFTEDEKVIARNIDKKYKWIFRSSFGTLYVCERWREEGDDGFVTKGEIGYVNAFNNLFKQIRRKQKPILIRDIYDPRILDDAERRYLEGVIRPLPNVSYIKKVETPSKQYEYINVWFMDGELTNFPRFKAGTMYEGMEPNREYTLEELGLFKGGAK